MTFPQVTQGRFVALASRHHNFELYLKWPIFLFYINSINHYSGNACLGNHICAPHFCPQVAPKTQPDSRSAATVSKIQNCAALIIGPNCLYRAGGSHRHNL